MIQPFPGTSTPCEEVFFVPAGLGIQVDIRVPRQGARIVHGSIRFGKGGGA